MTSRLLDAAIALGTRERFGGLRRALWRQLYNAVSRQLGDDEALCLNYGYIPVEPLEASQTHHPEWPNHALYYHVAAPLGLAGKRVVEVGCGRGGGAAYLVKAFQPAAFLAFDNAPAGVKAAQRIHRDVDGLEIAVGDASALPLPDASVDVVVNVESSHCYPSMTGFVSEVARILKPGGRFGIADLRLASQIAEFDDALADARLRLDTRVDITERVLAAMAHLNGAKMAMIEKRRFFRGLARQWAGTEGSRVMAAFRDGDARYLSVSLTRL